MKISKTKLSLLALLTLGGCDTLKTTLGLDRSEPDEFNVIDRHHLTTPPGYGLRPPVAGQENPAVIDPHAQAQESIMGKKISTASNAKKSAGERALLDNLSKHPSDKEIRSVIANEQKASQDAVNSRLSALSSANTNNKDIIDPHAEYEDRNGQAHPSKPLEAIN